MPTLIKTARKKMPPRTMPKRVTAIFNGSEAEAKDMLLASAVGDAEVLTVNGKVAIQHASLDTMGVQGVEDACLAAQYPLHLVIEMRDFRDRGRPSFSAAMAPG